MLKYGYGGRILRIDLTNRRYKIEPLEPSWIKPVIGGRGANTKRLFEELDGTQARLWHHAIIRETYNQMRQNTQRLEGIFWIISKRCFLT